MVNPVIFYMQHAKSRRSFTVHLLKLDTYLDSPRQVRATFVTKTYFQGS